MIENTLVETGRVRFAAVTGLRILILRIRNVSNDRLCAIGRVLGSPVPEVPNRGEGVDPRALWLGPGEWLIKSEASPDSLARSIGNACGAALHHLADVTDGLATFTVKGPDGRAVLSTACSLDLHPRTFSPGRCARTQFSDVTVVLDRPDDSDRFVLHVDRSVAAYVRMWLSDAIEGAPRSENGALPMA